MERHEQIRVLKEILHRLDDGTNVDAGGIRHNPTWVYTCPEPLEQFGDQIRSIARNLASIIRDEDYAVAARSQLGAEAGVPEYNVFGRNEPALHHYHNTYREALGMEPLELIDA